MVQRPRPDLRGGCAAMRIPTVTGGRGAAMPPPTRPAREHLFDAAKAIYGSGTDTAKAWGQQRSDELDLSGGVDHVIAALEQHPAREEVANAVAYFRNNRRRMRYAQFRQNGLCVSSGVIEGACKSLVGKRLKQGGMHWTVDGANAIIALRCALVNDRFDDFWERRAARRAA